RSAVVEVNPKTNEIVWEFAAKDSSSFFSFRQGSAQRLPNGNTLILAWEFKSIDEAIAKGRDPNTIPPSVAVGNKWVTGFWADFVREVNPAGETVWEWHVWDHVGVGPNKLDLNYRLPESMGSLYPNFDWTHFNTVDYVEKTDQILLNSRNFSEAYLVNHKTGAIEWRWGNKSAYGQGEPPSWYDNGDQKVFGSHNATPLENGNIQIFDNGSERPEGNRSAVVEVNPKTNEIVWEFAAKDSSSFFSFRQGSAQRLPNGSFRQGSAQRLPNGNVLVTSTHHGHIFEVTQRKQIVWDYVVPIVNDKAVCTIEDGAIGNMVHRAYRYGKDYPGLEGKDLSVKGPLAEGCPQFYKVYEKK
ncbi:MAG: arylsulfotransferase family protein, partial [Acidobacteriota bacterium]